MAGKKKHHDEPASSMNDDQDDAAESPDLAADLPEFPAFLYRSPGPHPAGGSKTYDAAPAADPAQLQKLLDEGWSLSVPDALKKAAAK